MEFSGCVNCFTEGLSIRMTETGSGAEQSRDLGRQAGTCARQERWRRRPLPSRRRDRTSCFLVQTLPRYTDEARKAGVEGDVRLQVVVRKDGTVNSLQVLKGLGYALEVAAINDIAPRRRFELGAKDGVPVDIYLNIKVTFRLEK
jgi:TonB family protein